MARCPAHDDQKASLSIGEGTDGRILVKCFAGCLAEDIVAACGLKLSDLFTMQSKRNGKIRREIVETYPYRDEKKNLIFECVRYEPKDFRQRRPDPADSRRWIWDLKGIRRVLYRLSEIKVAIVAGETIYIAEGEKDVGILVENGFAATCNPLGAKEDGSSWLPEYTETLRGAARVVVIADKDETGRCHARCVATELVAIIPSVRLIELPDHAGRKVKDAHDFFVAGGTAGELRIMADTAPAFVSAPPIPKDSGQTGQTPAAWFDKEYPSLADEYGKAVLEETNKEGVIRVRDIGQDFLAASLGGKGSPDAPTVFIPTEQKFYTYSPNDGIFCHQHEASLISRLSNLLFTCARACKENCKTESLEFGLRDAAKLSGVVRKAHGLLAAPPDFFATNLTEFIPCANGMLRLSDKKLLPFSPSYRRRNKLAVPFDSSVACPLFLDTVMRPALDCDALDLLQRWSGLALIGENLSQKIILLTGTPGGGKGTFIRVLSGIIGQMNLATLRPHLLSERFELSHFLGKTLLYGADVPQNFLNQRGASVLKSLTGGDPMTLEFKKSNERPSIICKFNVIVTCNSRIPVYLEGDTEAWRRRLGIVLYEKPKAKEVVADLAEQILRCEASGVLNWMLKGLDKLQADGWQLHLTARQQALVDDLLCESDGLTLFVRETLRRVDGCHLTVTDSFSAYAMACSQRGWTALSRKKFGDLIGHPVMQTHGLTVRKDVLDADGKEQRGWIGLRLLKNVSQSSGKPLSDASNPPALGGFTDGADEVLPVDPTTNSKTEDEELRL